MSNGFSALRLIHNRSLTRVSRQSSLAIHLVYNSNYAAEKRTLYQSATPLFMGENTNGEQASVPADAPRGAVDPSASPSPRKLKILMLHGYTQSGPLFHAKTRSLEKLLFKSLPAAPPRPHQPSPLSQLYPGGPQLLYPTGPIPLFPADIPGYSGDSTEDTAAPDVWGWWKRETGAGRYAGIEEGLQTIAEAIKAAGGIDGVIGFSQGAAAAAMVASLLQPGRREAFESYKEGIPEALAYQEGWRELQKMHPEGLKFAVLYSGFYSSNPLYTAFYEPKISCPTLHFIGSLDTVVEESRSLALVGVCEGARTVYHPGGHFVPAAKEWGAMLVGFIKQCIEEGKEEEKDVRDMDFPF